MQGEEVDRLGIRVWHIIVIGEHFCMIGYCHAHEVLESIFSSALAVPHSPCCDSFFLLLSALFRPAAISSTQGQVAVVVVIGCPKRGRVGMTLHHRRNACSRRTSSSPVSHQLRRSRMMSPYDRDTAI